MPRRRLAAQDEHLKTSPTEVAAASERLRPGPVYTTLAHALSYVHVLAAHRIGEDREARGPAVVDTAPA